MNYDNFVKDWGAPCGIVKHDRRKASNPSTHPYFSIGFSPGQWAPLPTRSEIGTLELVWKIGRPWQLGTSKIHAGLVKWKRKTHEITKAARLCSWRAHILHVVYRLDPAMMAPQPKTAFPVFSVCQVWWFISPYSYDYFIATARINFASWFFSPVQQVLNPTLWSNQTVDETCNIYIYIIFPIIIIIINSGWCFETFFPYWE